MPVSNDNQTTSTSSSISTTTILDDSDKNLANEDSVATTTISTGSDGIRDKDSAYPDETDSDPIFFLVVAEQRFRFRYRPRFWPRRRYEDDEFPALR